MFGWFMAGWVIAGIAIGSILISAYKTIVETEDGSDWFYE
jgi:hypothetical protein